MLQKNKKEYITFGVTLLVSLLLIVLGYWYCKSDTAIQSNEFYRAEVTRIGETLTEEFYISQDADPIESKTIFFEAQITGGPHQYKKIVMTQYIDGMHASQPKEITAGDRIIVSPMPDYDTGEIQWLYVAHNRSTTILLLLLAFFGMILFIGRGKGVATIVSLCLTTMTIFTVYIPSILAGKNIYASTIAVSFFIILMSLILLNGINKKSICAIIGNFGGILVAGALALLMNELLSITGVVGEEYVFLMSIEGDFTIDLRAIVWGGILIGSLGAVMDVAMSIASAMNELSEEMQDKTIPKMVQAGMNIGRDAIGTMTNTLILAYVGSSLATVLLLVAYNNNLLYLFNMEMIVVEVLKAIIGSMGILFAVPITVLVSAYCFNYDRPKPLPDPLLAKYQSMEGETGEEQPMQAPEPPTTPIETTPDPTPEQSR